MLCKSLVKRIAAQFCIPRIADEQLYAFALAIEAHGKQQERDLAVIACQSAKRDSQDTITALRAENERLKQSIAGMQDALECRGTIHSNF